MSQLSLSLDSSLLVRDVAGDYRPANADEVLQAAQRVLGSAKPNEPGKRSKRSAAGAK